MGEETDGVHRRGRVFSWTALTRGGKTCLLEMVLPSNRTVATGTAIVPHQTTISDATLTTQKVLYTVNGHADGQCSTPLSRLLSRPLDGLSSHGSPLPCRLCSWTI